MDRAEWGEGRASGDGWTRLPDGSRRWGLYGAAGLLVVAPGEGGAPAVLLQLRAAWTNFGGTWGIPGGARDRGETAVEAALRETAEETGLDAADLGIVGERVTADAGVWSYTTVLAVAGSRLPTRLCAESVALEWVPADAVAEYDLIPAFATAWGDGLREWADEGYANAAVGPDRGGPGR